MKTNADNKYLLCLYACQFRLKRSDICSIRDENKLSYTLTCLQIVKQGTLKSMGKSNGDVLQMGSSSDTQGNPGLSKLQTSPTLAQMPSVTNRKGLGMTAYATFLSIDSHVIPKSLAAQKKQIPLPMPRSVLSTIIFSTTIID